MPPRSDPTSCPDLADAVRAAIARHRLLDPGERVLVGVSGGADSVALLHALTRLAPEYGLDLTVCHVHHGLRPEADRDAALVSDLGARLGCPVLIERVRVTPRPGRSPEAVARVARYAALDRAARATGATRIALGHTADDQAETVLMRLLQGAGPRGLAGIPVRRGRLIRPLLEVDRAAIVAYLHAHRVGWVEDATNQDQKLLRNRIRHELLPLLAAHGWPRIRVALRRTARASREAVEALDALLAPRLAALVRPGPGGSALALAGLHDLPPGARKALLRLALGMAAGARARASLRAPHLDQLAALVTAPVGARVRLPEGLVVERARDALWVGRPAAVAGPMPLAVPGETRLSTLGVRLVVERGTPDPAGVPASPWEAWFDASALAAPLVLRPPRPGDRVVPFGSDRPVRVARLLAAAGVARAARRQWPLLVEGDETVLWIVGQRRGAAAPVTPATPVVLRVRAYLEASPSSREDST
ncbi:MAG TPA: tRNA lysidine(34) synthetase TilS [Methylomirabilota bacterium]|jgi:tRNA(Ile)-lysidine synthase|nr:tRNA lysidine(34) synthetase TilS [Methylomirabilota bacterium]